MAGTLPKFNIYKPFNPPRVPKIGYDKCPTSELKNWGTERVGDLPKATQSQAESQGAGARVSALHRHLVPLHPPMQKIHRRPFKWSKESTVLYTRKLFKSFKLT